MVKLHYLGMKVLLRTVGEQKEWVTLCCLQGPDHIVLTNDSYVHFFFLHLIN